jgi:phosphoglycolate phosphatase
MIGAAFGVDPGESGLPAMRDEFLDVYGGPPLHRHALFAGMRELLEWLEAEGIAWGVVTNKFKRFADPSSRASASPRGARGGRWRHVRASQAFPDPLLHAIDKLGVPARNALYVGDDERDVQAARAAGMPVLVAGYGYLGDGPAPSQWGADGSWPAPPGRESVDRRRTRGAVA